MIVVTECLEKRLNKYNKKETKPNNHICKYFASQPINISNTIPSKLCFNEFFWLKRSFEDLMG